VFPIAHVGINVSRKKLFSSNYSNLCEKPERHGRTDGRTDDLLWHNRALRIIIIIIIIIMARSDQP